METFKIRSYETAPNKSIRLFSLINLLEEAAWVNSHELGYSVRDLMKQDISWVMQRMLLQVDRWPKHMDTIKVETWPSGLDRYYTYRDFRVFDDHGNQIAWAKTNWIVLDLKSRRMISIPQFIKDAKFSEERDNLPAISSKVKAPEQLSEVISFPVMEHHIDQNDHVNNAHYFQWCLEGLELGSTQNLKEIDMTFKTEALLGDTLVVERSEDQNIHLIQNERTKKTVVIARTTFG